MGLHRAFSSSPSSRSTPPAALSPREDLTRSNSSSQWKVSSKWLKRLGSRRTSTASPSPTATPTDRGALVTIVENAQHNAVMPFTLSPPPLDWKTDYIAGTNKSTSFPTSPNPTNNTTTETDETENPNDQVLPLPRKIYPALLSSVALEFQQKVVLSDRIKHNIEYKAVFDGQEAVDKLLIILGTKNRSLAIRVGRSLGAQRLFHDVHYENELMDSSSEIYQFSQRVAYYDDDRLSHSTMTTATTLSSQSSCSTLHQLMNDDDNDDDDDENAHGEGDQTMRSTNGLQDPDRRVNGIFTPLTYCYAPTCTKQHPCYSYACPQKRKYRAGSVDTRGASSTPHAYLQKETQQLWVTTVPSAVRDSISPRDRKRQEIIYELIYTEFDYVMDLEYIHKMWINPLRESDVIPLDRREYFIKKVFSNLYKIYQVNSRLIEALLLRQKEHPIVHHIGDILLRYAVDFEPYIHYGAMQYEGKCVLEHERFRNRRFNQFAEETERHPSSRKLELNGYLTKPTTRLGRYTLFLDNILKYTQEDHPDRPNLLKVMEVIKQFLTRVNTETGKAKNRYDLDRLHQHILFKNEQDELDLNLMDVNRQIIKQGTLRKASTSHSTEYHVILLDHYLLITKMKMIGVTEYFIVQTKPIPLPLLSVTVPSTRVRVKRTVSVLPQLAQSNLGPELPKRSLTDAQPLDAGVHGEMGYPIAFQHLGRYGTDQFVLYASSLATRKPWLDQVQKQQSVYEKLPIFKPVPRISSKVLPFGVKIHQLILFSNGKRYALATDAGVYVASADQLGRPKRILELEKVTQIHIMEPYQLLLVLADKILWEYPLSVFDPKCENPLTGKKVQGQVPFFHVGTCLNRTLVCVPRTSPLKSTITTYEACHSETNRRQKMFSNWMRSSALNDLHLQRFKDVYVPSEAWALDLTPSKVLITSPRGIILVDMQTAKPQQLLNPRDRQLSFVTDREKEESNLSLRPTVKHIHVFRTPSGHHFVCYDEFAFYIDGKGNRVHPNFFIEWAGAPECFSFHFPYVIAFEPSLIEIRNIITGDLEQIIQGNHIRCIQPGHKLDKPVIFYLMEDPDRPFQQTVFELQFSKETH
ncbi:uncharacterized protein BYT42DRAFT_529476 [Radiomyces spectabilis]|uniref:uncharacterized protein n=1 Tax=Radiomyces spectabilis TaxID=64574 RepID=UPI0022204236|nr:uncharacterized protein BYT42DRAFT_529476 [Radiomyces spectabilis]KAI8384448.1 hypothetical protein BYT42DRAFT_529476 [Radiomyces spectabilis]